MSCDYQIKQINKNNNNKLTVPEIVCECQKKIMRELSLVIKFKGKKRTHSLNHIVMRLWWFAKVIILMFVVPEQIRTIFFVSMLISSILIIPSKIDWLLWQKMTCLICFIDILPYLFACQENFIEFNESTNILLNISFSVVYEFTMWIRIVSLFKNRWMVHRFGLRTFMSPIVQSSQTWSRPNSLIKIRRIYWNHYDIDFVKFTWTDSNNI